MEIYSKFQLARHTSYRLVSYYFLMGCGKAFGTVVCDSEFIQNQSPIVALETYPLKYLLNISVGVKYLTAHSLECDKSYLMQAWNIIQEYKSNSIVSKDCLVSLRLLLEQHVESFPMSAEFGKVTSTVLEDGSLLYNWRVYDDFVDRIERCCYSCIREDIYKPFIVTSKYLQLCNYFNNPECWITHQSFGYLNAVAQGGFGLVLLCKKLTTGHHYAMKIQPKAALLSHFRKEKSRVMSELEASLVLTHPFIAGISYAFQTETLVMLVSPVVKCGDLSRSLKLCPNQRMCLDRVVFYTAEISSALMYMHRHNIMYRDLKPANVLLDEEGHIKLVDFGSLAGIDNISHV